MPFRSPCPDVTIPDVPLTTFVLANAGAHRDRPALVDASSGRTITFGELIDRIRRLAAGLSRRGIGKGDVVAIFAPNLPDYAVVFHAVARLGAVITPANPTYTVEELRFQLQDAGARLLITTEALLGKARDAASAATQTIGIVTIDRVEGVEALEDIEVDEEPPRYPSTPPMTWW